MRCTPHAQVAAVTLIAVALLLFVGGTADAATADEASRVVELTRDTFDAHVSGPDKYTFVLYCVKWSRQCKTMIRLWDRLSISQSKKELREVFTAAYVDGDKYPDLVERVNVKGFPTMLFYTPLHTEGLEYNGPRELYLLDSFVFQFSMPSYPHTTGACRSGDMATGTSGKATRRRIVCCAAPTTTVRVAEIYTLHAKENDPFKSTVCMDYHVLSRIEGDLRRAEMRQENPESVMPDRGYLHDQEAYRTWDEYITTKQSPSSNRSVVGSLYPSSRGESRLPPIMLPRARSRRGSASSSHYASVPNSTLNTPTSNRRSGAPGSNRKGRQMSRSLSPGGQAHSSAHSSPWQHKGSSPTHQLPSLYPPNDRLGPAHSTCKAPKWRKEAGCCEVNGAAAAWNSHKTGRKHSLELSELEEGHEQQTVTDAERERRLHLADELASRMESAVPCVLKERREAG